MSSEKKILITDPCYVIVEDYKRDQWKECNYGTEMENLGITQYFTTRTGIGDGSWNVYKCSGNPEDEVKILETLLGKREREGSEGIQSAIDTFLGSHEIIGKFCADSGQTSVFYDLEEVKEYNPGIEDWLKSHSWCATVVSGFEGEIKPVYITVGSGKYPYKTLSLVGIGNYNFFTA